MKQEWNQFIIQHNGSFLQSYQWGQFQESISRKIWRINKSNLKALIIKHDLPFGKNYLYCPRGPVGNFSISDFQEFLKEVRKIAKEEKSIFFKIEPEKEFKSKELISSKKEIQPKKTVILNLTLSEKNLLEQMHSKTRYNIRLAERKGIIIEKDKQSFNIFIDLLEKTAKRDNFYLHERDYYKKMLEQGIAELFVAKYQKKIISANLVCFFNQTAIYLHGASDYKHRNLMASYLLQWQAILEAKKRGFKYYDFWGIDEKKWPGITRFKKGFSSQETVYPGAFDLIFKKIWYRVYRIARKIF